jgi:phosphoribosylanthranilate isomerase
MKKISIIQQQKKPINIKVCGITSIEQMEQMDKLHIDFVGLCFDENASNNIIGKIEPTDCKYVDIDTKKIGIFKNQSEDFILEQIEAFGLDLIQLNGNETPAFCFKLSKEIEVIKNFNLDLGNDHLLYDFLKNYDEVCDYYIFNGSFPNGNQNTENHGWQKLIDYSIEKPFFIGSEFIKPSDATSFQQFKHPDFLGIELGSRFEKNINEKDSSMILSFSRALNQVVN